MCVAFRILTSSSFVSASLSARQRSRTIPQHFPRIFHSSNAYRLAICRALVVIMASVHHYRPLTALHRTCQGGPSNLTGPTARSLNTPHRCYPRYFLPPSRGHSLDCRHSTFPRVLFSPGRCPITFITQLRVHTFLPLVHRVLAVKRPKYSCQHPNAVLFPSQDQTHDDV